MKESILQKFIRLFRDIDKEILPNANVLERIYIVFDFLWEKIKYNIELIDYVQYRFYFKRRIERDQFITHGKLLKIIKICYIFRQYRISRQRYAFISVKSI